MKRNFALIISLLLTLCFTFGCRPLSDSWVDAPNSSSSAQNSSSLEESITLEILGGDYFSLKVGEGVQLEVEITGEYEGLVVFSSSKNIVSISPNGYVTALSAGECVVYASVQNARDAVTVKVEAEQFGNPYENLTQAEFYANYTPATSYLDSVYRTECNLMSGSIEVQSAEATQTPNALKQDGKFVKNTEGLYSSDGKVYYVVDYKGEIILEIYKGGAYVTLEEVAAYLYAFNDIPANYTANKKGYPSSDPWGKYLRVNHTKFSGDTNKYPREPELPNINGCGGTYQYYELDIGTAGYNNGSRISRGASRVVYSRFEGSKDIEVGKKYLFYTSNHYDDFREYLNYYNGWGEVFGYYSGGGTGKPSPYVEVVNMNFSILGENLALSVFGKYVA